MTRIVAVAPPAVTVSVSAPSVSKSFSSITEIVATPLALTVALPLSEPPDMSTALIPERVYGTDVPDARPVVVRKKIAAAPSLTEELPAIRY